MYNGIYEAKMTEEEMANFYEGNYDYDFCLKENQYFLVEDLAGNILDEYKFSDGNLQKIKYETIDSVDVGLVKPRNIKQRLYFDLLTSDIPLKVVTGNAGSGKSYLATAWALQQVYEGKFDKLVVIKPNFNVDSIPDIGALPGDINDKLREHCAFISDIVSPMAFDKLIADGRIEMVYLGTIRGRSLAKSIVLCSEAQNLDTKLVKTIVTRIGEGSVLIFDYDLAQIDVDNFQEDNGMRSLVESLAGEKLFGMVELDRIERSAVARLAEKIKKY